MMRLTLHSFTTLDGVVQAPGGPEEDPSDGFGYGGWSFTYGDEDSGNAMADWFGQASAFLLGRKTYEMFRAYWPKVTDPANPFASKLNALPKYVASTTLTSTSTFTDWDNSFVLGRDVAGQVAKLKEQPGDELQVHGSGGLANTLIEHDLIDEYRLLIYPVHLGRGKKLFRDDTKAAALRLTGARTTSTGVIVATYQPAGPVRQGGGA
jgi:dihydrofolate reductase